VGLKTKELECGILLWQIIVAKELALRLEHSSSSGSGFTPRILASLIISKLWLTNVEIILADSKINAEEVAKPKTQKESAKAEGFKTKGNEAMKGQKYKEAVDFYTEAIKIDLSKAIYRSNRSAALLSMGMVEEAHEDALVTTRLDPNYAKGWSRLGFTELKLGNGKRAQAAYQRAIEVAGPETTAQMKQGLADSEAKIDADLKAIEKRKI
jgi:tetratricopeptide (TPR) repeat protein